MATMKEKREEALELFLRENGDADLELDFFHSFLCPVALAEAMVREHIVEDYDALELLVLRLYDIGFHDVETIASVSGMKTAMIERALHNEFFVYNHIDSRTGKITAIGRRTLEENEGDELENHVMYLTPRRFQVEAVTGTVIPSYLEEKTDFMKPVLEEWFDGIIPQERVEKDEELQKEINDRIKEYKHMGILNEGDTIKSVEKLESRQIFYRWAYLTRYKGMKYPMIALRGYKAIEKVNNRSRAEGKYGKHVVIPISIARSDYDFLAQHGISFEGTIVREDRFFEYLNNNIGTFNLYQEEEMEEIPEDETPEDVSPEDCGAEEAGPEDDGAEYDEPEIDGSEDETDESASPVEVNNG